MIGVRTRAAGDFFLWLNSDFPKSGIAPHADNCGDVLIRPSLSSAQDNRVRDGPASYAFPC